MPRVSVRTAALVLAAMICGSASAQATVIYSDNFNADTSGLSSTPAGWSVTQGSVDIIGAGSGYDYYPGNGLYIDLNGSTDQYGGIKTNTLFGPGTYIVRFNLGSSLGGAGGVDSATTPKVTEIFLGNSTPVTVSLSSLPKDWTTQVFTFTTTVAGSLVFDSLPDTHIGSPYNQDVGNILDNVSVATTPLPSTWIMLIGGLVGLAYFASRGTRKGIATGVA
jgi:hypothetical protein